MKRFITTLAGKTILFIVCIASVCLLAASIAGIVLYVDNGEIDFYTSSESEIIDPFIEDTVIRPYGYTLLWDAKNGHVDSAEYPEAEYRVTSGDGSVIAESKDFDPDKAPVYTVW